MEEQEAVAHPQDLLAEPYTVERTILGVPVRLSIETQGGRDWYDPPEVRETGTYDIAEMSNCEALGMIGPGQTVFDVGAHQGVYSVYLAKRVGPTGSVVAFEPIARNTAVIAANAELNGLGNIEIVTAAVGEEPGTARLNLDSTAVSPDGSEEIAMVALDDYAELRPGLLKLDVEGFEIAALRGARRVLEGHPHLLLEVHPAMAVRQYGQTLADVLALVDWDHYDCSYQRRETGYLLEPGLPDPAAGYDELPDNLWIYGRARRRPRLSARIRRAARAGRRRPREPRH